MTPTTSDDTARRPAAAERRPSPDGWCYRCGFSYNREHHCALTRPLSFASWANILAGRIERTTEGLEGHCSEWTQKQADLARAIAAVLIEDADYADRHRAGREPRCQTGST